MAGMGSRFAQVGYELPKPFIDVDGKPMIVRVLENLYMPNANFILLAREEHLSKAQPIVKEIQERFQATFVSIPQLTEGTACTVLYARKLIQQHVPLLIANSDQLIDSNIREFVEDAENRNLNGSILCFEDSELNPKWSFAAINDDGFVTHVREKEAISPYATVGIYYFSSGFDFVNAAIDMIIRNDRVNNEFYTCPVYNYLLRHGAKVGIHLINQHQMHGIGTPEDLEKYLRLRTLS
jgi:dTDP-glucose pyrophosphorylase